MFTKQKKYLRMKVTDIEGERSKPQIFTPIILCYIRRTWIKKKKQVDLC